MRRGATKAPSRRARWEPLTPRSREAHAHWEDAREPSHKVRRLLPISLLILGLPPVPSIARRDPAPSFCANPRLFRQARHTDSRGQCPRLLRPATFRTYLLSQPKTPSPEFPPRSSRPTEFYCVP